MSTALLESPLSPFGQGHRCRAAGGPGLTLEERLEAAWRAVQGEGVAECPVCRACMHAEGGADEAEGARPAGASARCGRCGTTLS